MPTQTVSPIAASPLIPMLAIFVIFYFLLIRPQQKKEKERLNMIKAIKKNDQIVTSAGIHATVLNAKDKTVTVRIDDNVKMEIDKDAIHRIEKAAE